MIKRVTYRSAWSGVILVLGMLVAFGGLLVLGMVSPNLDERTGLLIAVALFFIGCASGAALWATRSAGSQVADLPAGSRS
jgi:hypothetical protein